MPCSASTASSTPGRASKPAWTAGCSVFPRPSMISGNAVIRSTSVTLMPASRKTAAVPPVETISKESSVSDRANSAMPCLSETLRSARRFVLIAPLAASFAREIVALEFLAEGAPVDAEYLGGSALVAFCVVQHGLQQRSFDFTDNQLIEVAGFVSV